MAFNKTICIRHCTICDTLGKEDTFVEWLKILKAGTKLKVSDSVPYLDLKHIIPKLKCVECNSVSLTQVIFEWISNNESEDKEQR